MACPCVVLAHPVLLPGKIARNDEIGVSSVKAAMEQEGTPLIEILGHKRRNSNDAVAGMFRLAQR